MNRRGFLQTLAAGLAGTVAAHTLDLERLLWVPGEKSIFIPSGEIFSGNQFVTPAWVTREVARHWMNEIKLVKMFDSSYADLKISGAVAFR